MINSKEDYEFYKAADDVALLINNLNGWRNQVDRFFFNDVWRFLRLLRKAEFYQNCKTFYTSRMYCYYQLVKLHRSGVRLGFYINPNCFGLGLSIMHFGTIIVNSNSRIGANCRIHPGVTIGDNGSSPEAPKIGDNVFIGPGAKVLGGITVADGIAIGANSVVNQSFLEPNITIAGAPAVKISNKGSSGLVIKATETVKKVKR